MSKAEEKALISITQRLDRLEKKMGSQSFLKTLVDSIKNVELCANCRKVVMATFGKHKWVRKGFYQCGSANDKMASWCNEKCEKAYSLKMRIRQEMVV